jgi:hypothetical protein
MGWNGARKLEKKRRIKNEHPLCLREWLSAWCDIDGLHYIHGKEVSFPSSLLVIEGRRGQTLSGWPNKRQRSDARNIKEKRKRE